MNPICHVKAALTGRLFAIITLLLSTTFTVRGDEILNSGLTGATASNISANGGKAVGFTMGTTAYTLDSISMKLAAGNITSASDNSVIALYSSTTGGNASTWKPDSMLAMFATPTFTSTTPQTYTMSLGSPSAFTLQANTTYWIVAYNTSTSNNVLVWYGFGSTATVSGGVAITSLTNWYVNSMTQADPGTWTGVSSTYNDLVINATVANIPEPSTLGLVGGVLALIATVLRRRGVRRIAE